MIPLNVYILDNFIKKFQKEGTLFSEYRVFRSTPYSIDTIDIGGYHRWRPILIVTIKGVFFNTPSYKLRKLWYRVTRS